jgi:hypothetical protein
MLMFNRQPIRAFAAAVVVLLSAGAAADASISTLFSISAAQANSTELLSINHQDTSTSRLGGASRLGNSRSLAEALENLGQLTRISGAGSDAGTPLFNQPAPFNTYPIYYITHADSRVSFAIQTGRLITITDLPPPCALIMSINL